MAKLILSMDSLVLKEIPLNKERITIGRKPSNDIQIDNLTISGEHAVITTVLSDSFIEDLDSTNGTMVNGKNIRRHALKANDLVEMGKYALKYIVESSSTGIPVSVGDADVVEVWADTDSTTTLNFDALKLPKATTSRSGLPLPEAGAALRPRLGAIRILDGPSAGKGMDLTKPRTTLGRPNRQVVAIVKHPDGYHLLHLSGSTAPKINNQTMNANNQLLREKDVLEIAGARMEFYYKN